jgi:type III secretory pathway component EscT
LFAAQIVLGMLSKAVPQMNVYWLGFPFQIMLSFLLVTAEHHSASWLRQLAGGDVRCTTAHCLLGAR